MTHTKARLLIVASLLLVAALVALTALDRPGGSVDKTGKGILEAFQGTATARSEQGLPEPSPEPLRKPAPGQKSDAGQSFEDWWFHYRFPNWVDA